MEDLAEAKELAMNIASSLPKEINIAALSHTSKLPFKALSLRELLIHRESSMANGAVLLYENGQSVPAVVLTRAAFETTALLFALYERTNKFLENENTSEFDNFLMASLVGSRAEEDMRQSINVMNHIKRMDLALPGTLKTYEILCEYAHPNWAGLQGAYGKVDKDAFIMNLGPHTRPNSHKAGISALCGSLLSFHHYYNALISPMKELNLYFEGGQSAAAV